LITAKNFWFWFGGIWLAVGLVFLTVAVAVGIDRANRNELLAAEGVTTIGTVITKSISSDRNRQPVYRVTFDFETRRGDTMRASAALAAEAWDALVEREAIDVTYVPERPEIHRVPGESAAATFISFVFGLVGAVLSAIGGFVLVHARRTANSVAPGAAASGGR